MIARLKLWGAAVLAAIIAIVTFGARKRRQGKDEVRHEFEQETSRRVAAGRDKVSEGRDSGLPPADRVRRNDDNWGGL